MSNYDIVLFGATGFVGKLTAEYLARQKTGLRIALAGRSREKLQQVAASLPDGAATWPLIVVDSSDVEALEKMAQSTRLVISTVGPYSQRGLPLVGACAKWGTDYVDLTGETFFVRDCADQFDQLAQQTKARIVNSCGFDSIPSDLGVLALADAAQGGQLQKTTLLVTSMRGGFSGGTLASMRQQMEEMSAQPSLRKVIGDPYGLSPNRSAEPNKDGYDNAKARYLDELGVWTSPFVMATFNTRIVRRSNALLDYAYGRDFQYQEYSAAKNKRKAKRSTLILGLFVTAMQKNRLRKIISRFLPKPGTGPSPEAMRNGRFRISIFTSTSSGKRLKCKVGLDLDPGYMGTALMLVQSALCLLETQKVRGGVLTPASAMGMPLIHRLRGAGMTIEVTETR